MADILKLVPPPPRDGGFDEIHNRLFDEVSTLRVVTELMRHRLSNADETLLSAHTVLMRCQKRLDDVHTEFERWDMRRRGHPPAPEPPGR